MAVKKIHERFGEVLRRRRIAAGVSQEALADLAGVHRNYVGLLERGKQIPSILIAEKLAEGLGTTLSSIFKEVERLKK